MGESTRALQEFVSFLSSPDMYGSMSTAAYAMKWAVHFVVTILMIFAIVGIILLIFRIAIDILFLSGLANFVNSEGKSGVIARTHGSLKKIASEHAIDGDPKTYLSKELWRVLLTLALIGLLASGMMFPIAGQIAGAIGAGVDKVLGLDPAGVVADFDPDEFRESVQYTRDTDLKNRYDRYISDLNTYMNYIYDLGSQGTPEKDATLNKYKRLYTAAYVQADVVSGHVNADSLKLPANYFTQHRDLCKPAFIVPEVAKGHPTCARSG